MDSRDQAHGLPRTLLAPNIVGERQRKPGPGAFARRNPANRDDIVTLAPESTREEVREAC